MAGALAWYCIFGAVGDLRPLVVLFAFSGLFALGAGLLNVWAPFNALGAGCLGAAYLALVYSHGEELGAAAPAVAAALLLIAELAWYSLELAGNAANDPRLLARRLALIGVQAVGAAGLGYLLLLVAAAPLPGGVAYTAAGAAAALAAVGVLARLVGSRRT
ncbi:MAG TPA: hypothetical protein VIO84_03850 [Candidatus Dormibacteraeota bacterium]|jgi:hypothetical protein